MVPNRNGAVTSAVLVHLRVEPAHFDWRWRERPALALLAWEALARDPLPRLCRIQVESTGTTVNFRPAAITYRDIASALLHRIQDASLVRTGRRARPPDLYIRGRAGRSSADRSAQPDAHHHRQIDQNWSVAKANDGRFRQAVDRPR